MLRSRPISGIALLAILLLPTALHAGTTLERIRQTGTLRCGINRERPEYSTSDDHGARAAFDADLCRAVAVALLGPGAKVAVTQYDDDVTSMAALGGGKVDLLPTLTFDLTHATAAGIIFSPPVLYDGVGFLVPASADIAHAEQLGGKKICFLAETEVEVALRQWFGQQQIKFLPFPFQEEGEMEAAFMTGNCTALAGDRTRLANTRLSLGEKYALLPEQVSSDPLAAASRADDAAFARIVFWTMEVLLNAEESGLTQKNIAAARSRPDAAGVDEAAQTLLGQTGATGTQLGLRSNWAAEVIAAVGNYGEIYARDLDEGSPLKLPRGENRLARDGGLMLPLPLK